MCVGRLGSGGGCSLVRIICGDRAHWLVTVNARGSAARPTLTPDRGAASLLKTSVCSRAARCARGVTERAPREKARVLTNHGSTVGGGRGRLQRSSSAAHLVSIDARASDARCSSTCRGERGERRRQAALRRQCARSGRCVGCGIIRAGKESASAGNRSSRGSGTTILPQRQRERRWGENVCVWEIARSVTTLYSSLLIGGMNRTCRVSSARAGAGGRGERRERRASPPP